MSELEKTLNEFNTNGELVSEVEVDIDDLDVINYFETTVESNEESKRFETCIHIIVSKEECDPVNLKCDMSCKFNSGCIFNPYSEYYNMPMDEFKECIAEQQLFDKMVTEFCETPEGQEMLKEMQERMITVVENYIANNK
jgi:hypothetical protein